jgi:hypothetical protein
MDVINPTLEWYTSVSQTHNLPPRCPFISVHRCPRYYQSLSLLGDSGISTNIDPEEDNVLLEEWKKIDLWPITKELSTSLLGAPGKHNFSNFCPEVSFEIFGLFASYLTRYPNKDMDKAHAQLSEMKVDVTDWRWRWFHIEPMHYSQCPLFSPLSSSPIKISRREKRLIGF